MGLDHISDGTNEESPPLRVGLEGRKALPYGRESKEPQADAWGWMNTRSLTVASRLFAGGHEVGGRGARIHDPHATLLVVVRQPERLRSRAGHGDGHVRSGVLRV